MLLLQSDPALPLWLLVICAALILLGAMLLARRSRTRSARWKLACLLLPTLAALFALAAAANLQFTRDTSATRIVLLLDLSASTRSSPWQDPAWVRTLAQHRLPPGTRLTILPFAGEPHRPFEDLPLNDAARWPTTWPTIVDPGATNLPAALAWRSPAEAALRRPLAPRWLLSDGCLSPRETPSAPPFPFAATILPPTVPDLAITAFTRRSDGELWIQVATTAPTHATLTVTRDAQIIATQSLTFTAPSTRWISIGSPAQPGRGVEQSAHRYQATIRETPDPDPWPENDTASLITRPEGPPRVLLVGSPDALPLQPTASIAAAAFPTSLTPILDAAWQTIILNDIPLAQPGDPSVNALTDQQAATLARFVHDAGGGLLILGAAHAFGPGHYAHSPLDPLSPLASEQPHRPAAQIIFLLDASGSMNDSASPALPQQKFQLAAHAVQSATTFLQPTDDVALITFNNTADLLAAKPLGQLIPRLAAQLASVQPTGPTNPDSALPTLQRLLAAKPPAERTLVILLTDGQIPALTLPSWQSLLASPNTRLALIAPASQDSPLATLAHDSHATWLTTDDPAQWQSLLERAIAAPFIGDPRTDLLPWHTLNDAAPLAGTTRTWIETWLRPGDNPWIVPAAGDSPFTLGATAQRGLGKVAAISMHDPSPAFPTLLHHALNQITPAPADPRFTLSVLEHPGGWTLSADAIENHHFLNHERLLAKIFPADAAPLPPLPFHQTAPGHYETSFAAGPFTAVITRETPRHPPERIATLHPAQLATNEWPATVGITRKLPDATPLSSARDVQDRWHPTIRDWQLPLSPALWSLSIVSALLGLLVRRAR